MNYSKKRLALAMCTAALLSASLSACGGGDEASAATPDLTPAQQIQQLEDAGTLPKLDRSADIKGPDADNNGIRDDIDALIEKTYPEPAQRAAASQYARAAQEQLLVDKSNKDAVKAVSMRSMRAIRCLITQFGTTGTPVFSQVRESLSSYTADTKSRLKAQLAYSEALDGTVISLPRGNTCE